MRLAAEGAARLLAAPDGPRIAALAFDGFDTHQNEGAAQGVLAQRLQGLDAAFDAFETDLGDAWADLSSSRSPNSAAPFASTAPTAPIMARRRLRFWPAARLPAAG